ncbi:MAG: 4Fe-4S binding protein [Oscillospiraceae bacterium]|nr:4Fe-4S binding protein [Oscillospiraceae bacterium]
MKHSVTLDKERCRGCTTCVKHCPTEAIRVRRGRAHIIEERCIDCGECIRVCPNKMKKAVCDPFDIINNYKYKVALPDQSLYGQFRNTGDLNLILAGLLEMGFDMVAEVAEAAEYISMAVRELLEKNDDLPRPLISSACPAVVRLICMRFPKLMPHLVPLIAPFEAAAIKSRKLASEASGLPPEEIGIFLISPCAAKATATRYPMSLENKVVDGVLSMTDVYKELLSAMKNVKDPPPKLARSGPIGVGWARAGGEMYALPDKKCIAVDGIENIIRILEDLEDGMLPPVDFLELDACNQGCVGGVLTAENPYVARAKIAMLTKQIPESENKAMSPEKFAMQMELVHAPAWKLDDDFLEALKKAARIEELRKQLPGLNCGSCGAPSCRALAEDIVLGIGNENDCIFRLREKMQNIAGSEKADDYLPPPFRRGKKREVHDDESQ